MRFFNNISRFNYYKLTVIRTITAFLRSGLFTSHFLYCYLLFELKVELICYHSYEFRVGRLAFCV